MISNGIDLVKIERFAELVKKDFFMNSVFTNSELEYITKRNRNLATVAGIFAAKEAFLKAIKKGIHDYPMKDIEISHDQNNAPFILLYHDIKEDFLGSNISLSIAHDGEYAVSIVTVFY